MMDKGVMMMPKQVVGEGQKHGYIGETEGEVKTFEVTPAGSSNTTPDVPTAQARVDAAQRELTRLQKDLVAAKQLESEGKNAPHKTVGVVGGPPTTPTTPTTP